MQYSTLASEAMALEAKVVMHSSTLASEAMALEAKAVMHSSILAFEEWFLLPEVFETMASEHPSHLLIPLSLALFLASEAMALEAQAICVSSLQPFILFQCCLFTRLKLQK